MKIKKSVSFSEAPPLVRLISDQSEARKNNTQTSEEYEKNILDSKREDDTNIIQINRQPSINLKNIQPEILNNNDTKCMPGENCSISGGKTRKRLKRRKTIKGLKRRKTIKGLKRTRRNNLH